MHSRTLKILNETGFHARPATLFVQRAQRFRSAVRVATATAQADGRSVLSLMLLAATGGTEIAIEVTGEDESEALEALVDLVEHRFEEATAS